MNAYVPYTVRSHDIHCIVARLVCISVCVRACVRACIVGDQAEEKVISQQVRCPCTSTSTVTPVHDGVDNCNCCYHYAPPNET